MRTTMILVAAAIGLTACGGGADTANSSGAAGATTSTKPAPPVKQQPGSWSNKMTIVSMDVGNAEANAKMKEGMQTMLDAASAQSVCVTQAMADQNSFEKGVEQMAAQGKTCDFSRKMIDGDKIDFAGICSDANGTKLKIAITGTAGATAQEMRVVSEPVDTGAKGSVEMRMTMKRNGECKPGDMQVAPSGAVS